MKRLAVAAMIAVMAVGVFTGCGTSQGTAGGNQSQNSAAQTTDQGTPGGAGTVSDDSAAAPSGTQGNNTNTNNTNGGNAQNQTPAVSQDDAIATALGKVPGATNNDIRIELDWDDGRQKYEGEIHYNQKEYDFEIDANTGEVIEWSEEKEDNR